MILIDNNTDTDASSSGILVNHCFKPKLESNYLNKIRNVVSDIFNVITNIQVTVLMFKMYMVKN